MTRLVDRVAAALAHRAVVPGDRVVAQVEKSPEAIALYLACLRLGAVFVPLNTAYTAAEIAYFLSDADPKIAVGVARAAACRSRTLVRRRIRAGACACHGSKQSDLAALLYTSGTTGRSKGAMLTRANLATNAITLAQAWRFTENDVLLHALPIFHVHGLFVAINTVLAAGSSMLFLSKFDADEVVRLLPRSNGDDGRADVLHAAAAASRVHARALRNIRLFVSGSAPLLAETHREFQRPHRARDPGALRHERDAHEHIEPVRRRARRPARSVRRCRASKFASRIPSPDVRCPTPSRSA